MQEFGFPFIIKLVLRRLVSDLQKGVTIVRVPDNCCSTKINFLKNWPLRRLTSPVISHQDHVLPDE